MCDIGLDLKQSIKLQIRVVKNRSYSGILLLTPSHEKTRLKTIFFSHFNPHNLLWRILFYSVTGSTTVDVPMIPYLVINVIGSNFKTALEDINCEVTC